MALKAVVVPKLSEAACKALRQTASESGYDYWNPPRQNMLDAWMLAMIRMPLPIRIEIAAALLELARN